MASELWQMLPPDMTVWNTAVMETLVRKVPEAGNYVSGISWSSLDPSTGNGDGLIAMLNGLAAAPITIRANKLAPIDLMVTRNGNDVKFYPLSDMFLRKVYADNVIGEPVDNQTDSEESYEGPARRIQNINTVNAVKYASIDAAKQLFETITKTASVANWVSENMPETFLAIYNRANEPETEKKASADIPDLVIVQKVGDAFYMNDEQVDSETAGAFLKMASATPENRALLMSGVPFVYDAREKVASIHIPTEQEVTQADVDKAIFEDNAPITLGELSATKEPQEVPSIALTTAFTRSGEQIRGIVFNSRCLRASDHITDGPHRGPKPIPNPIDPSVDADPYDYSYGEFSSRELFISDKGYAVQESIKSTVRTPISASMLCNISEPSNPAIGMIGIFIKTDGSKYADVTFGRIDDYYSLGAKYVAKVYDLVAHTPKTVSMDHGYQFYEVNPERLSVLRNVDVADTVSMTGIIGRVVKNDEGDYIIDDKKVSAINCPYALMQKYAASYEDALKIASIAAQGGSCVFEIKTAADNDNADKTKNKKGTKSGTDDEGAEVQPQNPSSLSLTQQTPETAMSIEPQGQDTTANPFATGTPQTLQSMGAPVSSKDLENVVQLNDSQVMDAYMMSNLAATDMTSQETLNKASDSIVDALSKLSQLLFLVRQGSLSYIPENDVQVAMNKLTDVAQSLGIDPMQVGTM